MTALSLKRINALYRSTDTVYSGRFWPLVLTNWVVLCCLLFLQIQAVNYLSGVDLSEPKDILGEGGFIFSCLTVGPIISYIFTIYVRRLYGIRLTNEGIAELGNENQVLIRWSKIEVVSVKRRFWNLLIKMSDSKSDQVAGFPMHPGRYLDFCRKSLELAPDNSQIAHFLKNEINRLAEIKLK